MLRAHQLTVLAAPLRPVASAAAVMTCCVPSASGKPAANPALCWPLDCSVLLWHRSDNLAFVLVLGGASAISVGTVAECKIKGVLQVSACTHQARHSKHSRLLAARRQPQTQCVPET